MGTMLPYIAYMDPMGYHTHPVPVARILVGERKDSCHIVHWHGLEARRNGSAAHALRGWAHFLHADSWRINVERIMAWTFLTIELLQYVTHNSTLKWKSSMFNRNTSLSAGRLRFDWRMCIRQWDLKTNSIFGLSALSAKVTLRSNMIEYDWTL